jgi:hypothetical protein
MILEIDDDFSDQIVVNVLADSYVSMKSMLKNGIVYHEDDIAAYNEVIPAIEVIGNWFSTDFATELKKANKRMNKLK